MKCLNVSGFNARLARILDLMFDVCAYQIRYERLRVEACLDTDAVP